MVRNDNYPEDGFDEERSGLEGLAAPTDYGIFCFVLLQAGTESAEGKRRCRRRRCVAMRCRAVFFNVRDSVNRAKIR